MESDAFEVNSIVDQLILLSQKLNFLNYSGIFRTNLLKFIDIFQKNEDFELALQHEINCYLLTYHFYGKRKKEELIRFYRLNGDVILEMQSELKKFCEKYNLKYSELWDKCEEVYEENHEEYSSYAPITRIDEDGYVVCDDYELLETIKQKQLKIVYPEYILKLRNISTKHYSDYLEIVSLWIFLNISQLIQIHTDINQRNANEIATVIVNSFSIKKLSRSAYEKASSGHIHPKAHGAYIYEYYGQIYYDDLLLVRKTIKLKEKTVKKTSFKNLKNIISIDLCTNKSLRWNI